MKLIVGLGNPGKKYEDTRHNIGALALDYFAKKAKVKFKLKMNLKGFISEIGNKAEKVVLLKPTTYMNLSGDAIAATMKYYGIDKADVLVIYDDLDLPRGVLRLREQGSAGGHNGLKSIIGHIGTVFTRIRIGIDSESYFNAHDFVLGRITAKEKIDYDIAFVKVSEIIEKYIAGQSFVNLMNEFN